MVYNDDEDANDFNGFGYGANETISGGGSEDYENQSVNVSVDFLQDFFPFFSIYSKIHTLVRYGLCEHLNRLDFINF